MLEIAQQKKYIYIYISSAKAIISIQHKTILNYDRAIISIQHKTILNYDSLILFCAEWKLWLWHSACAPNRSDRLLRCLLCFLSFGKDAKLLIIITFALDRVIVDRYRISRVVFRLRLLVSFGCDFGHEEF